MNGLLLHGVIYFLSFIAIWLGSGLIISSVEKLSHQLRIPRFLISFVILGILTSTPEIAVGLSSVSENTPEIFVGNLLGGIPVIFLFIIPLLAIFGGGMRLHHDLNKKSIVISLLCAIAPFFVVLDNAVSNPEGFALIAIYIVSVVLLNRGNNMFTKKGSKALSTKRYSFMDIVKVLGGAGLVFLSSNIIVDKTIFFSHTFGIEPFYISLILLSLGTNLPEITLAIYSIFSGKKDIAFGDYLGSASANTLLFGIFTLMIKDPIFHVDNFLSMFVIVLVGVVTFYYFSRTKHMISRKEGAILFALYIVFILVEIVPQAI